MLIHQIHGSLDADSSGPWESSCCSIRSVGTFMLLHQVSWYDQLITIDPIEVPTDLMEQHEDSHEPDVSASMLPRI